MRLLGQHFRYFLSIYFHYYQGQLHDFISMWYHVRVTLYCGVAHLRYGPGGVLGSLLFVFLDIYILTCFYPEEAFILLCVDVQTCLVVS